MICQDATLTIGKMSPQYPLDKKIFQNGFEKKIDFLQELNPSHVISSWSVYC